MDALNEPQSGGTPEDTVQPGDVLDTAAGLSGKRFLVSVDLDELLQAEDVQGARRLLELVVRYDQAQAPLFLAQAVQSGSDALRKYVVEMAARLEDTDALAVWSTALAAADDPELMQAAALKVIDTRPDLLMSVFLEYPSAQPALVKAVTAAYSGAADQQETENVIIAALGGAHGGASFQAALDGAAKLAFVRPELLSTLLASLLANENEVLAGISSTDCSWLHRAVERMVGSGCKQSHGDSDELTEVRKAETKRAAELLSAVILDDPADIARERVQEAALGGLGTISSFAPRVVEESGILSRLPGFYRSPNAALARIALDISLRVGLSIKRERDFLGH